MPFRLRYDFGKIIENTNLNVNKVMAKLICVNFGFNKYALNNTCMCRFL